MKKTLVSLVVAVCMLVGVSAVAQQDTGAQKEPAKKASAKESARWEGIVQAANKDKSTLMVRQVGGNLTKTIHYDESTRWVSQEHGSKTANPIDSTQVKEGDRVICRGKEDKSGFHATLISKRLTPLSGMR